MSETLGTNHEKDNDAEEAISQLTDTVEDIFELPGRIITRYKGEDVAGVASYIREVDIPGHGYTIQAFKPVDDQALPTSYHVSHHDEIGSAHWRWAVGDQHVSGEWPSRDGGDSERDLELSEVGVLRDAMGEFGKGTTRMARIRQALARAIRGAKR